MLSYILEQRLAFLFASIASLGSLFFSEILKYPPCVLCWYQRIAMYPLVFIYFGSLWFNDKKYYRYSFPLIIAGLSIAIYHNLLYYNIIPDSITPCTQGVSCTSKQLEYLGFITIPLLSLTAFLTLFILDFNSIRRSKKYEQ